MPEGAVSVQMLPDRVLMLKAEKVGRRHHMANVVQHPAGLRYTHRAHALHRFGRFVRLGYIPPGCDL